MRPAIAGSTKGRIKTLFDPTCGTGGMLSVAQEYLRELNPDAWVDESKTKVGYEINFNRYFYKYQPPRPLAEIERDLKAIENKIVAMLAE